MSPPPPTGGYRVVFPPALILLKVGNPISGFTVYTSARCGDLLALVGRVFGLVRTVVEATFEQLHSDDCKDELEQHVDDHDVEHVLERIQHAVEDRLQKHDQSSAVVCTTA